MKHGRRVASPSRPDTQRRSSPGGRLAVALALAATVAALAGAGGAAGAAGGVPYVPPTPVGGGGPVAPAPVPGTPPGGGSGGVGRLPVVASGLRLLALGPYSATLTFRTSHPVVGRVAYGVTRPLLLASDDRSASLVHSVTIDGLLPGRRYEAQVLSHDGPGGPLLVFQTRQKPADTSAEVAGGGLLLDRSPFLPLLAFAPCPWNVPGLLAAGVNVVVHDLCDTSRGGRLPDSVAAVGRRAWNVLAWDRRTAVPGADGVIGYSYVDEPDGRGTPASALPTISARDRVSVLTLTHHVVTGGLAWAVPGYYGGFLAKADLVGFDYYPLQEICRRNDFAAVFDLQRDLVALAGAKATFQWIEVGPMRCSRLTPENARLLRVTPATVRAEMMLAVAGGAGGLGVFPSSWDDDPAITAAVRSTYDQLAPLTALLAGERLGARVSGENAAGVRVGVRRRAGALLAIVVNADVEKTARARIWSTELAGRGLAASDGTPVRTLSDGTVELELAPLEARILVSPARSPLAGG